MSEPNNQDAAHINQAVQFLQNCPDCAVIFDRDWSLVYANTVFQARFCGGREALGSNFLSYLDGLSGERLREMQPQILEAPRQIELKQAGAGAKTARLQYFFFPLNVPASSTEVLIAGIGRDRTADIALLNEVLQLNVTLEQNKKDLSESKTRLEQAYARLEQVSEIDQITQLYNRYYFFQVSQHLWEEAKRYKFPLVVMMMDLDNFKTVNDTFGHLFGDHVLQQVSLRLKINTRKSDILARFGGEELVLLAPNTDMPTALLLAERLRAAVADQSYVMGSCSAIVTISVGISGTELENFETFDALLESSDHALYCAKRNGKNCFFSYADSKTMNP